MNNTHKLVSIGIVLVVLTISCSFINVDRGDDGSLRVETTVSMDLVQAALEQAAQFEQVVNLQLEPREGYVYVHADTIKIQGITGQDVSFHLELGDSNGTLTAKITNVQMNNNTVDSSMFEPYNQLIADRLNQVSEMTDRATLESASVTTDGIKMVWLLNTSSGN